VIHIAHLKNFEYTLFTSICIWFLFTRLAIFVYCSYHELYNHNNNLYNKADLEKKLQK